MNYATVTLLLCTSMNDNNHPNYCHLEENNYSRSEYELQNRSWETISKADPIVKKSEQRERGIIIFHSLYQ